MATTAPTRERYRDDPSVLTVLKSPRLLTREALAGLVVALALIPEAISFSIIAGVDPRGRVDLRRVGRGGGRRLVGRGALGGRVHRGLAAAREQRAGEQTWAQEGGSHAAMLAESGRAHRPGMRAAPRVPGAIARALTIARVGSGASARATTTPGGHKFQNMLSRA